MTDVDFPDALPAGHRLHWYVLERVLGQGGFGITYLAHDSNLDRPVAIKEYLPTEIARRRADASARPHTESHAERYAWGLGRFLAEARTLARFDHPNIVRVLSVFEANNTAYMVMRFEEGEDLATLLDRRGTLPERQLTECLLPILDGLQLVHAAGFIHRDIKPENIYVRKDGSPVLLDFGSARQSFGSAKTMTILVAPGYAPLEQYYGDAATQGPWTDIYGLGATCYRAIAGQAPLDAVARAKGVLGSSREMLQSAVVAGQGRYSERLLEAVDRALQLSERDRPQSIADWRRNIVAPMASALPASSDALVESTPVAPVPPPVPAQREAPHRQPMSRRTTWLWGGIAGVCALVAAVVYVTPIRRPEPAPAASLALAPASTAPAPASTVPASVPEAARAPERTTLPATAAAPEPLPMTEAARPGKTLAESKPVVVATKLLAASRPDARSPAPQPAQTPSQRTSAATETAANKTAAPVLAMPADPSSPASASVAAAVVPAMTQTVARASPASRSARDEQIDAAEAALRRGDNASAAQMLAPWAAAGVPRAQALLGRAQEARSGGQQNFEAYVWYGIAARAGQPEALSLRDKVAAKLQPAEIRQAEQIIEHWKPRGEAMPATTPDRTSP
jgi:serine/threonine protein kinase